MSPKEHVTMKWERPNLIEADTAGRCTDRCDVRGEETEISVLLRVVLQAARQTSKPQRHTLLY